MSGATRICPERDDPCPHGDGCQFNTGGRYYCDLRASREALRTAPANQAGEAFSETLRATALPAERPSDAEGEKLEPVAQRLLEAYDKVKFWPENSPTGFADLLALRNMVPEAADAIASLTAQLREARAANEHDRSVIIDAHNAISDAIKRRSWLMEGRGSYEWEDDRYRQEFAAALAEIAAPLSILNKLGVDWSHCPTVDGEIQKARIDWQARAEAAEAQLREAERENRTLRNAGVNLLDRAEAAEAEVARLRSTLTQILHESGERGMKERARASLQPSPTKTGVADGK